MRALEKFVFSELRITPRHTQQSHRVKWNKDRINAYEGNPKMKLADRFVHHAAKHLRKPEVGGREHAENRRHAHHQVKVRCHKVSVVEKEIERRLSQNQSGNAPGHEE